jgi:DNA-binding NarL/FixJ family response regulator
MLKRPAIFCQSTPVVLHLEDELSHRHIVRRSVGKIATIIDAGTVKVALETLATRRSWLALIIDLGLPDGTGWEVVARARETRPKVPVLIRSGLFTGPTLERAFREDVKFLGKNMALSLVRDFLRSAEQTQNRLHAEIRAFVRKTAAVRLDLSPAEALFLESELCGLPRGHYADGTAVSDDTIRGHMRHIYEKACAKRVPIDDFDDLCRYFMRQLTGVEAAPASGINIKAKRDE